MTDKEKAAKAEEKKKLEKAKAKAKEAAMSGKVTKTRDTITFRKNSGSGVVFAVLERAGKPLSLKEIQERSLKQAKKDGIKMSEGRPAAVAKWFVANDIATKSDEGISLPPKSAEQPAK